MSVEVHVSTPVNHARRGARVRSGAVADATRVAELVAADVAVRVLLRRVIDLTISVKIKSDEIEVAAPTLSTCALGEPEPRFVVVVVGAGDVSRPAGDYDLRVVQTCRTPFAGDHSCPGQANPLNFLCVVVAVRLVAVSMACHRPGGSANDDEACGRQEA